MHLSINMDSTISERFYSGQGSMLDMGTPWKRLPNPDVNNVLNEVMQEQRQEPNDRALRYSLVSQTAEFTPLSQQAHMAHSGNAGGRSSGSDHLFSKMENRQPEPPVLIKPLKKTPSTISPEFLPPKTSHRLKNPLMRPKQQVVQKDEDLDDDEAELSPSGAWTSPVVKEALRRQVNKEKIFRSVWANLLRFVVFRMVVVLAEHVYKAYSADAYTQIVRKNSWTQLVGQDQGWFQFASLRKIQYVFVVGFLVGLVRLVWPQDQCYDLPLTETQRRLIGLRPLGSMKEADEEYAFTQKKRVFESRTGLSIDPPKYHEHSFEREHSFSDVVTESSKIWAN